jgi:hypothetical protein
MSLLSGSPFVRVVDVVAGGIVMEGCVIGAAADYASRLRHPDTAAARRMFRGRREYAAPPGIARDAFRAAATLSPSPSPDLLVHPLVPSS